MRHYFILSFLILLLAACDRENPSQDGNFMQKPYLIGTYQAGAVDLAWTVSEDLSSEDNSRHRISAERFVVEMSESGPESLTAFQTLGPATDHFLVEELTNDQPYYFAIRAEAEGKSVRSNVIMVIPRPIPLQENFSFSDSMSRQVTVALDANFYGSQLWLANSGPFTAYPLVNNDIIDSLKSMGANSFRWSPAQDKLLYTLAIGISTGEKMGQIGVYFPLEQKVLALTAFDPFYDHQATWSPDEQWIAYLSDEKAGNEYHIWKVKADASGRQSLTEDRGDLSELVNKSYRSPGQLAFTPQGDTIAFERQKPLGDGYVYSLYEISAEGGPYHILHDSPWNDRKPTYSPTGDLVAFFSDRSGKPEVWLLDRRTQQLTQLSGGENMPAPIMARGLRWSPDAQQLLYIYLSEAEEKPYLINR